MLLHEIIKYPDLEFVLGLELGTCRYALNLLWRISNYIILKHFLGYIRPNCDERGVQALWIPTALGQREGAVVVW